MVGVQCAVVLLEDVSPSDGGLQRFRQFGTRLFNHWGVGSNQSNDGLLILFFREARRLEMITGQVWSGLSLVRHTGFGLSARAGLSGLCFSCLVCLLVGLSVRTLFPL